MTRSSLLEVTYTDTKQNIHLTNYADTIVYDASENGKKTTICAIRFGGYPEMVNAMASALYGGGSVSVTLDGTQQKFEALSKQYRKIITHNGPYAEATLIAEDDSQQAKTSDDETPDAPKDLPPRTTYIFSKTDDPRELFEAVDQKTAVPLILEYQDFVLSELKRKGILKPLKVISASANISAWTLRCSDGDKNIVDIVEKGLKHGDISIPGAVPGPTPLDSLHSVTQYLNTFGVTVAERIKKLFVPQYDPAEEPLSPEVVEINDYIHQNTGYSLFNAQLAVAEAIKRQLTHSKVGLIVAECGAGKSKIGVTAIAAVAAGLHAEQHARGMHKTFNLILCPSHITEKWVREVHETLPNTFAAVIRNINELNTLYGLYQQGTRSCYAILSKEQARDGYMRAPAVIWNQLKQEFVCPDCGAVVERNISEDGTVYRVKANQFYFLHEHSENHKCEACGTSLWTALNPSVPPDTTPWIKLGSYGYIFRKQAAAHLKHAKNDAQYARILEIAENPNNPFPARGARRAFPLSTYIKRYYKGKIDGLIVDELHQYNNKSGQGEAMAELFGAARKVVGTTATLINGYSSGIFHLLYRIVPHLMKHDGKNYEDPSKFDAEYGVIQNIYEEKEADYNSNRRTVRIKKATRQLPGVSPLVYSNFLMEYAAFLSLADMGKELPEYEEVPVPLEPPTEVRKEYERIETALLTVLKTDKKAARKLLSAYLNLLTAYPDQPYGQEPILHPIDGYELVVPTDTADARTMLPKVSAIMEIAAQKIKAGERVLIYTNWTRLDTQQKLLNLLSAAGYRTTILPATVNTQKREQWVADRVAEGTQILITNPILIETGLDLNAFTTLIFCDVGYKLFTLRQASRRSWRINQKAPRVEVYLLYYAHTMQHKAIKLMASKLAVAGIIEGNFSEEGLAAMSECEDMMSQMARELMQGIKDNVEDVSSAFKRMAFLKPVDTPAMPVFTDDPVVIVPLTAPKHAQNAQKLPMVEFTFGAPAEPVAMPAAAPRRTLFVPDLLSMNGAASAKRKSRQNEPDENQLSFFERSA